MVLDAQNTFSALQSGDSPTAIGDTASANYIDQMVAGLSFSPPGGGAYVAPWLIVQVTTAFAGTTGTIQAVFQDSPDATTWTDRILGAVTSIANAAVNLKLLAIRILPSHARYLRVVYRIATAVMTAGTLLSFLTLDQDVVDISLRTATAANDQAGQISEAVNQGILRQ